VAISQADARQLSGDYDTVFRAVLDAARAEGFLITGVDWANGTVYLSREMSVVSWGENLHVEVGVSSPGTVDVTVRSSLKFGLVDWGRNKKNLARLFSCIETLAAAPAQGTWHPDPSGRHQLRWWDGQRWTEQVSDGASVGVDPLG